MSDISVSHEHGMTLDEAKEKTEQIVTDVKSEFPSLVDQINWNSDKTSAEVKGKAFSGQFAVNASHMSIDIKLKLLARPFKAKIEEKIQERIVSYFA